MAVRTVFKCMELTCPFLAKGFIASYEFFRVIALHIVINFKKLADKLICDLRFFEMIV